MHGWGLFFFLLFLLLIFGAVGWVAFTQYRARKAGLPPPSFKSYIPFLNSGSSGNYPSPRSAGPIEWIKDKISSLTNRRSARGAYEEPSEGAPGYSAARRGRGLDPDDAWDARVVNEADAYGPGGYYEEQELGLHTPAPEPYGGAGYGGQALPSYGDSERGRSKSRDAPAAIGGGQTGLDVRYDEEMGRRPGDNPFGDQHEASSLRDVSPRPVVDTSAGARLGHTKGQGSQDDSPTERRSMFRESL
ncbi:hypothetical protein UCRPC4_g01295 [Phaeomoniella chlamydospora]|uniref:Acid phosphatase-like protein n=1 Tax=Phaeomoniella chlamydospora TaxID=158046 RepID=A0A0G2HF18_PHACM|nr:hypothetical protein UCRPC4_g01295 [Phaeomoniella chlamydospora]